MHTMKNVNQVKMKSEFDVRKSPFKNIYRGFCNPYGHDTSDESSLNSDITVAESESPSEKTIPLAKMVQLAKASGSNNNNTHKEQGWVGCIRQVLTPRRQVIQTVAVFAMIMGALFFTVRSSTVENVGSKNSYLTTKQKEWMTIEIKNFENEIISQRQDCITHFSGEEVDERCSPVYSHIKLLKQKDWVAMIALFEMKFQLGEEHRKCMSFLRGEDDTGCSLEYARIVLTQLNDWVQQMAWERVRLEEIERIDLVNKNYAERRVNSSPGAWWGKFKNLFRCLNVMERHLKK